MTSVVWQSLATSALLGTDQRPADLSELPADVARALDAAGPAPGPHAVLVAAALTAAWERGGARPLDVPELEPPPTGRPPTSGAAAAALADAIRRADTDVVVEALVLTAASGVVLPAQVLPALFDVALTEQAVREAMAPVLGARGRWLAQQREAWQCLEPVAPDPSTADPSTAQPSTAEPPPPEDAWAFGSPAQRVARLAALRARDPAAARSLLAEGWAKEPSGQRAALLRALATGLSAADEAWLERCLDDRRGDVRAVAASLLAALPSSAYAARMRSRRDRLLQVGRRLGRHRLIVADLGRLDDDADRDQVTNVPPGMPSRGNATSRLRWWATQILAATPLDHWDGAFGGPSGALAAAVPEEFVSAVLDGWGRAAVSQQHAGWAASLAPVLALDVWPDSAQVCQDVFALLSPADRFRVAAMRLDALPPAEVDRGAVLAEMCPGPWSDGFTDRVLHWLVTSLRDGAVGPRHPVQHRLPRLLATRAMPTSSVAARVLEASHDLPGRWSEALATTHDVLVLRTRLHQELT